MMDELNRIGEDSSTTLDERDGGARDFDFQVGAWRVKHRRLRVIGGDDWEEFDGSCSMALLLGGNGNIEDNILDISTGSYRAVALRSFDAAAGTWAIWWLDHRRPHALDTPVIGRFEDGIGCFYGDDGAARIRFLWTRTDTPSPRWEQAMSIDDGKTWNTNWVMDFSR